MEFTSKIVFCTCNFICNLIYNDSHRNNPRPFCVVQTVAGSSPSVLYCYFDWSPVSVFPGVTLQLPGGTDKTSTKHYPVPQFYTVVGVTVSVS